MKKYIYIISCLLSSLSLFTGCSNILDTSPRDILTDATLWGSKDAINAYLGELYDQMETEDFNYRPFWGGWDDGGFPAQVTDEATRSYTWGDENNTIIPNGFQWWGYNQLRNVNEFIEKVASATTLSDADREVYKAEARFVRAFDYFAMVKRYGGVPIISKAQEYTGDVKALYIARNKESEVYDFIKTECDDIVKILPETRGTSDRFRATRYAAYALKCRAMLYAASIAEYSNVELNGVVGIDKNLKDGYWKEAKSAAEAIINSHKFSLYNVYASDKEKNFQYLFLDKSTANTEGIFTKAFSVPDKAHSFDMFNAPQSFKVDWGCVTNPTEDFVSEFEYTDGTSGELKVNDANGNPIQYSNPYDLFKDKDPRLKATVMLPFCAWQNGKVEIRKGIVLTDGKIKTSANLTDTYGEGANSITIAGKDGTIDINDVTKTGFYIKKFMNPTERLNFGHSDTYWMVFRYGEVLLNYAEACMELGDESNKALALGAINEIRNRAGIKAKTSLTLEDVRHERKIELAYENHRWWDLRRWRIADKVLNQRAFYALNPYLVWENNKKVSDMKYIFKVELAPKNTRTFLSRMYYCYIPSDAIATNPLLIQNPGY